MPRAPEPMTPDRWRVVDALLKAALALEPAARDVFVTDACGDDRALLDEVASLLAAHATAGDFLEQPAAAAFAPLGTPAPLAERLAGALAGRYAVERELAHGGMATVFLGRDLKHDRRVAIKVLREELAAALGAERFLEEIRVTASLQHPHILPLFDSGTMSAGQGPGLLYYVMPYVEGETLRTRLKREGRLPVNVAVQLASEVAEALEHAHRRGIVHRDVKPENILVHEGHAVVGDFGVALALEHAGGERLTRTGISIGTPQYMAPEQASAERTIDARADVYALGAVLHEMLAGESPFSASSRAAVLWRVRNEPATALATHRLDVAPILDAAVQRALAKRPEDRFSSAAAFASAITGTSDQLNPETAPPGSAVPNVQQDGQRDANAEAPRGRMVTARAAVYACLVTFLVAAVGGWAVGRSSLGRATITSPTGKPPMKTAGVTDWKPPGEGNTELVVVDRAGRLQRSIAANRPWTPRISPDGRRIAYGAFGDGRTTSDLWVTELDGGTPKRLTDDDADSNDPQWSADGASISYSVNAMGGKDLAVQRVAGGEAKMVGRRPGIQYASDWLRDGTALLVTEEAGHNNRDILVQPANGTAAWPYVATPAEEAAARISPDGRWVAYTSDESGRPEVYIDAYPKPGRRVAVSLGGGAHPVWRGDGRELYYWNNGALTAVRLGAAWSGAPPAIAERTVLFRASYDLQPNTMYDVTPDGQRFVIVRHVEN